MFKIPEDYMFNAGSALTYDNYRAGGWTDKELIDQGLLEHKADVLQLEAPPSSATNITPKQKPSYKQVVPRRHTFAELKPDSESATLEHGTEYEIHAFYDYGKQFTIQGRSATKHFTNMFHVTSNIVIEPKTSEASRSDAWDQLRTYMLNGPLKDFFGGVQTLEDCLDIESPMTKAARAARYAVGKRITQDPSCGIDYTGIHGIEDTVFKSDFDLTPKEIVLSPGALEHRDMLLRDQELHVTTRDVVIPTEPPSRETTLFNSLTAVAPLQQQLGCVTQRGMK